MYIKENTKVNNKKDRFQINIDMTNYKFINFYKSLKTVIDKIIINPGSCMNHIYITFYITLYKIPNFKLTRTTYNIHVNFYYEK